MRVEFDLARLFAVRIDFRQGTASVAHDIALIAIRQDVCSILNP